MVQGPITISIRFGTISVPVLYTSCRAGRELPSASKHCRSFVGLRYLLQIADLLRLRSLRLAVLKIYLGQRFDIALSSKALQLLMVVQRLA